MPQTITQTFHPSAIEALDINGNSVTVSNPTRCIGDTNGATTSSNYAQYYLVAGSQVETFGWITIDFSDIPQDATITSMTGQFKIYHQGSATYVTPKQIRTYINNRQTARGYSVNIPTSTTVTALDLGTGTWTRENLNDFQLRLYSKRTTRNVSSNYYVRIYGVDITVTYEVPDTYPLQIKQNDVWTPIEHLYLKENGSWVEKELNYLEENPIAHIRQG